MVLVHSPAGSSHLFLRQDELLWEEEIRTYWAAKGRDGTRWGYWHLWQSQPIPWAVEQRQEWKSPQAIISRRLGRVQMFNSNREVHGCLREVSTVLLCEPSSCLDRPWVLTPEVFGMGLSRFLSSGKCLKFWLFLSCHEVSSSRSSGKLNKKWMYTNFWFPYICFVLSAVGIC